MAVQPRELRDYPASVPDLALVPPPRRGHPVAASLFVLLLCAALSLPIVGAALEPPPGLPAYQPRATPAVEIMELDRIRPGSGGEIPSSAEPVAGVAFVRCTRLWVGDPDGSNDRRLLAMTGVSSPAFSPNGRTIAFVRTTGRRQTLWLAAADGSDARPVDTFRSTGVPVPARVSGLAWAGDGKHLAFALTDGTHGPLEGGSAVWTLNLRSGSFDRIGGGWPAPVWYGKKLLFGRYDGAPDLQLTAIAGRRIERNVNSLGDDLAAAVVPQGWWSNQRNGIAVLRAHGEKLTLAIRNLWARDDRSVVEPPNGYRFARFAQPTITQDGSRVAIDLLDAGAGRDVGLLDPVTGRWTILDHAWDPSASPTPTIVGPLTSREARTTAEMLFSNWGRRPGRAQMMTAGRVPMSVLPWKHIGWIVGDPYRTDRGWVVPAIAYSFGIDDAYGYRELDVLVGRDRGRLTATPTALGPLEAVTTLEDALAFAEVVVGRDLPSLPDDLPPGTRLAPDYAVNASSWRGLTATIDAVAPRAPGGVDDMTMSFSYGDGDDIDFELGCGGAVDPQPTEVAGIPAMIDRSGTIRQVIWRATPEDPKGSFSVHGELSEEEILDLAERVAAP